MEETNQSVQIEKQATVSTLQDRKDDLGPENIPPPIPTDSIMGKGPKKERTKEKARANGSGKQACKSLS